MPWIRKLSSAACAALFTTTVSAGTPIAVSDFEFFGCGGDWHEWEMSPQIWRVYSIAGTTFITRHPGACGADAARNPSATLDDGVLHLSYDAYSTADVYAMCFCELWAKFTFEGLTSEVEGVSFQGHETRKGWE